MKKVSEEDKASFGTNEFQWVAEDAKGVWIITLVQRDYVFRTKFIIPIDGNIMRNAQNNLKVTATITVLSRTRSMGLTR